MILSPGYGFAAAGSSDFFAAAHSRLTTCSSCFDRFRHPPSSSFPKPLDNLPVIFYFAAVAATATPEIRPGSVQDAEEKPRSGLEPGYLVICWNDPVNFMDYVTHVFQIVFGWGRQKAEFHMLQVHEQGKSVLARASLEKAEHFVHQLQKYSLHATMERDE